MRLDLFVKLKCESSSIILLVGIRYFIRDLYGVYILVHSKK